VLLVVPGLRVAGVVQTTALLLSASLNNTVPVGCVTPAGPVTVAVKVRASPAVTGNVPPVSATVIPGVVLLTVCAKDGEGEEAM